MKPLTIGAVVRSLSEDFPDVTISKVRFLEAEGLVTPERSGSGYRRYSTDDVERIRYVLRAQRELFWPLKVIREALEAIDRGLEPTGPDRRPEVPEPAPDPDVPDPSPLLAGRAVRLTAAELARASTLAPGAVAELVDHGLLRPGPDGLHGEDDLRAARAAAGLARYGVEARHLRLFRAAADREVGLVEQATGVLRGADARRGREEVTHLVLALHAALVRGGLGTGH
ncbi:transcriptional regulator FtsR [Phycicoccus sonneratiae]|uniref:MerR family transcriptional regulator n=1 Tax=Phycicoccus sonneratiae TaxID=2807628 RepID=A0ABS2CIK0_9MICO|nr:MerR family transcriptional regulator [Phycicoccus sonneraticus]MBM6399691.1 MerR family transcriptional regulator [Phycicoccus sonneraticus]